MTVTFPHANNYSVSDDNFREAWAQIISRYPGNNIANQLPRLHSINSLQALVCNGQQFSLEYLCRMLVPYRNTMQATQDFMAANAHIVSPIVIINPATGRTVQGAQLIPPVLAPLTSPLDIANIEALFEADVDELEAVEEFSSSIVHPAGKIIWGRYIDDFVDQINIAPYQPMYRNKAHGAPVKGWDARLHAYFWPNPGINVAVTATHLRPILARCRALAMVVQTSRLWNPAEEAESVVVANEIFKWGGVPQNPVNVTWQNVRNVFEAALTGTVTPGTLMNSGWTKIAAFATAHLGNSAQVIWDSRVSTSIVRRLDNIFHSAGLGTIPPAYGGIGLVAGQGGTRNNPPQLNYKWRNGYGRWDAQFVGSAFVQEVCKILNKKRVSITKPSGKAGSWIVRDVEMVLFGDGY